MRKDYRRRQLIAGLTGVAAAGLAMPHVARAAARSIRIGYNNPVESHYGQGAIAFAKAVAADPVISSILVIEPHGNAELGDELSMAKNCVAGTLDMVLCSTAVLGAIVPAIGLLNAPFIFSDVAHARKALDGQTGIELAQLARTKDLNVLAWGENGIRQFTSNKPIRTPQDIRGLKVRVPQSEIMMSGMRALGADAGALPFGQLPDALRTGQFDAEENAIVLIESAKLYEFQKYLSLTNHIYDAAVFGASPDLLEDLTEPQRVALAQCAQQGAVVTRQVAEAADRSGITRLKTGGMTVIDDVDVGAFRTAAQPYLDSLSGKFGADLVSRVRSAGV